MPNHHKDHRQPPSGYGGISGGGKGRRGGQAGGLLAGGGGGKGGLVGEYEMMDVTVSVMGLTGIISESIATKSSGNKPFPPDDSVTSGGDVSTWWEGDNPTKAMATFYRTVANSNTSIATHIPSLPLGMPTSAYGNTSRYMASWHNEGGAASAMSSSSQGGGGDFGIQITDMSSFKFSRIMKKEMMPHGDGSAATVYVPEKLSIRVGLTRGSEMLALGVATLLVTGSEIGEVQVNLPMKSVLNEKSDGDAGDGVKKGRFRGSKASKLSKRGVSFKSDAGRYFRMDEMAALRLLVRATPRVGTEGFGTPTSQLQDQQQGQGQYSVSANSKTPDGSYTVNTSHYNCISQSHNRKAGDYIANPHIYNDQAVLNEYAPSPGYNYQSWEMHNAGGRKLPPHPVGNIGGPMVIVDQAGLTPSTYLTGDSNSDEHTVALVDPDDEDDEDEDDEEIRDVPRRGKPAASVLRKGGSGDGIAIKGRTVSSDRCVPPLRSMKQVYKDGTVQTGGSPSKLDDQTVMTPATESEMSHLGKYILPRRKQSARREQLRLGIDKSSSSWETREPERSRSRSHGDCHLVSIKRSMSQRMSSRDSDEIRQKPDEVTTPVHVSCFESIFSCGGLLTAEDATTRIRVMSSKSGFPFSFKSPDNGDEDDETATYHGMGSGAYAPRGRTGWRGSANDGGGDNLHKTPSGNLTVTTAHTADYDKEEEGEEHDDDDETQTQFSGSYFHSPSVELENEKRQKIRKAREKLRRYADKIGVEPQDLV